MDEWRSFVKVLAGVFAGVVLIAALIVWLGNPYGNLPYSPLGHVLMDDNQRFQYPAVIRSRRYDSLVMGTSTGRLLDPFDLEARFGGRFANLALNSGTAWEQMRFVGLFAGEMEKLETLVLAIDYVWCDGEAHVNRITHRGFPEWLLDASPWNDLAYMLNVRTIEIAGRRLGHGLGLVRERWPHNGYEIFVPPEAKYDLAKARSYIYPPPEPPSATRRPPKPAQAMPGVPYPAMSWLEDMLDRRHGWRKRVLLLAPIHVAGLGPPAQEAACKAAIAEVARKAGAPAVDFRIPSDITRRDENYWDKLHYRVPIARRIVDGLGRALATGRDDPDGDWRILVAPPQGE